MAEDESDFTESFGDRDASELVFQPGDQPMPQSIGRYRIDRFLGCGGFGNVYLGFDPQLKRSVAIKVPHPHLINNRAAAESYLEEARNVANLDHPNIVPVFDVGSTDGFPCFIVSKYVEGKDLGQHHQENPLTIGETADVVSIVADALHYAHKKGLVHRDIKPNNLMLDQDDQPHVVDFGLALREENVGKGPAFVGTLAFMSPEQARGEGHRVDGRSDIFSLGVVLYFLLVGRRPFRADSRVELLNQISSYEARPLRQYNDQIPKELERICLKAMSKKATERYTTASDLAEDLRLFLSEFRLSQPAEKTRIQSEIESTQVGDQTSRRSINQSTEATTSEADSFNSASEPVKIIPKGLRSFDSEDNDFFLELVPGPRDRFGVPDVIRFWKTQIEKTDPDQTFSVGLIYGPSGCGKSSLVKAGLLPKLDDSVVAVYVEASPEETESRLLSRLRKQCPALDESLDLKESMAALRRGQGCPPGKKVLIVLDQFEQWLHAARTDGEGLLAQEALTQALRQCDGGRLQCVLMVRDDFWMAVTRLLHELEIELLQGHNFASVDLFPIRHAEKVLTAFGLAYGALSDENGAILPAEKEFIKTAVNGLADNGQVICVRLALFAEMMKNRSWTMQSLKEVGGTEGVGFNFLEETFNSNSNPKYRLHQKAAQAVLKALLPDSGTDIKGEMKSHSELLEISGYTNRPKDFSALMTILDREIRLVTPTDPAGEDIELIESTSEQEKYYQLAHDYLVHSLRQWLTRKEKETGRGRARLRLQELAATWKARPENRYLPSAWEYLRIRFLTDWSRWSESQNKMMKRAGVTHGIRAASISVLLLLLVFVGARIVNGIAANQKQRRADDLVESLVTADIEKVNSILDELGADGIQELADPFLQRKFSDPDLEESARLKIALAMLPNHQDKAQFLIDRIPFLSTSEFTTVCDSLAEKDDLDLAPLWNSVFDEKLPNHPRFLAGTALARLTDTSSKWETLAPFVAGYLTDGVPVGETFIWMKQLENKKEIIANALSEIVGDRDPLKSKQRETACLVLGSYLKDQPLKLVEILLVAAELHEHLPLFEAIEKHVDRVVPKLMETLNAKSTRTTEKERDQVLKAKSIAAVTLIKLDHGKEVWPHLKHSPDPSLRSFIVKNCQELRVDHDWLLEPSQREDDNSIRRALLLGAGHFQAADPPREKWVKHLLGVYEHDPDPGMHAAARYTLVQWNVTLPDLPVGLPRIAPERISAVRKSEKDVDYARSQLELSIEQLPEIRKQWEAQFLAADDSSSKDQVNLDQGLVVHFPFTSDQGKRLANLANADEPGSIVAADEPERIPGIGGNGLKFDRTFGVIAGRTFNPDLSDSFSMGCWIYFDDVGQVGSIISKMGDGDTGFRGFDLWFEGGRVGAHFKHEYPNNLIKTLTSAPIAGGQWHHVWVDYNGSGAVTHTSIYVDGKLTASDLLTNTLTGSFTSEVPLRVGGRSEPNNQDAFPFAGLIDDVRMYNRSLSASEVQSLYHQGLRAVIAVPKAERTVEQDQVILRAHRVESQHLRNLERQYAAKLAAASQARWRERPRWFLNKEKQAMVVIPQTLVDGEIPIPYDFAIGAFEVTVADFKKHNPAPGFLEEIVPTEDCPAHQLNWYDAAKYCNWLTQRDESIPPGQEIYLPNDQNEWGPGVRIKPNYKNLAGYRLPTEQEWEFAAKALSRRQYYFGEPAELLESYGWYASNSKARSYPVGSLLPNDFGLFDMQGNVWEWILDKREDPPNVAVTGVRQILGGGLNHIPSSQRSENSYYNSAVNRNMYFGFRVVRVLTDSDR